MLYKTHNSKTLDFSVLNFRFLLFSYTINGIDYVSWKDWGKYQN